MKIIIIGAGIAGLSTYLSIKKHILSTPKHKHIQIEIYEAYDISRPSARPVNTGDKSSSDTLTTWDIGSAIGISVNGLRVLKRLDESGALLQEMVNRGHPIEAWAMGTARGWKLMDVNLAPATQPSTTDHSKEDMPTNTTSPSCGIDTTVPYQTIMIGRQQCWDIFRSEVIKDDGVVARKKVVDVIVGDNNKLNKVKFEDGSEEEADLVIGADGLRSIVRKAMFGKTDQATKPQHVQPGKSSDGKGGSSSWFGSSKAPKEKDYVTPQYEGLVGVGGFIPSALLESVKTKPGYMSIVFGPNGFFGHGYVTSTPQPPVTDTQANPSTKTTSVTIAPGPTAAWWSTFSSPNNPYPFRLPSQTNANPKPYEFDHAKAVRELQRRHKSWKDPAISAIVAYVSDPKNYSTNTTTENGDSSIDVGSKAPKGGLDGTYPTWTTPELPDWQLNGRVLLVGDAAHALQPSSGQGACQALEDAEAFGLILKHFLCRSDSSTESTIHAQVLQPTLESFTRLRIPRLHKIYVRSQQMSRMKGDMGFAMEMVMYFFIWMMRFFKDGFNDELWGYDLPTEVEKLVINSQRMTSGS